MPDDESNGENMFGFEDVLCCGGGPGCERGIVGGAGKGAGKGDGGRDRGRE